MKLIALLLSLPCVLACAGSGTKPESTSGATAAAPLAPATCGALERLHVSDDLYLAGQPTASDLEAAKQLGIKTVINLRHAHEHADFDERAHVEGLGLAYVSLPWRGHEELDDAIFDRSRELLRSVERPILLHCASANRVGAVWLPHRVLDEGVPFEEALAEARIVGLKTPEFEAKARDYVERRSSGS